MLKPLPFGLTQKAIDAVQHWRFTPAEHPRGRRRARDSQGHSELQTVGRRLQPYIVTTLPTRSYGCASVISTRANAGRSFGSRSMPSLIRRRPSISGAWPMMRPSSRCSVSSQTPVTIASKVWPTLLLVARQRDLLLQLHQLRAAALGGLARRRVGHPRGDRRVLGRVDERAHVVELRPLDEVVQLAEVLRRLAGMAGDERRAQGDVRHELAHARDHLAVLLRRAGTAHASEDVRGDVLERDVDVRREARLAPHQLEQRPVERAGIGVQETDPAEVGLGEQRLRRAASGRSRCRGLRRSAWCPARRGSAPSRPPAAAPAPRARASRSPRERNLPRICGIAQNVHGFEQPSLTLRYACAVPCVSTRGRSSYSRCDIFRRVGARSSAATPVTASVIFSR